MHLQQNRKTEYDPYFLVFIISSPVLQIDAALDLPNIELIAAYIRRRTSGESAPKLGNASVKGSSSNISDSASVRSGNTQHSSATMDEPALQCLVISLKDALYEKAGGLVGIYRDSAGHCSRSLTLNLNNYYGSSSQSQPTQ